MDPPSSIMRDISTEQILEDLINDGAGPESPSTFLNPSGEGVEVDDFAISFPSTHVALIMIPLSSRNALHFLLLLMICVILGASLFLFSVWREPPAVGQR